MDLREAFRRAALADGLADSAVEAWLATARPQLALVAGDGPAIARFGGRPELPAGVAWPANMSHIATVDLAAVPAGSHDLDLPRDGRLVFFAETHDGVPDAAHVVHVPAGVAVAERELPEDSWYDDTLPEFPLVGRPQWTFPSYEDTDEEALAVLYDLADDGWDCPFTLGGHGYTMTGNGSEPLEDPATETVLATALLRPGQGRVDMCLTFTLTYEDLAARRFDSVHLRYDWDG